MLQVFQKIIKFKDYWFPSKELIVKNFCEGKETIFYGGFISATKESKYLTEKFEHEAKVIGLYYFDKHWESQKVVLFCVSPSGERSIESVIKDEYPNFLKIAAQKILENYQNIN